MKRSIISACVIVLLVMTSCEEKKQVKESINTSLASVETTEIAKISVEEFTEKAYEGNMAEVQLGEMAKKKASNKEVKQFAEMMIKDHGKANNDLKKIAQDKNIQLPETVSQEMKKKMDELKNKTGKEFDKSYMDLMVKDHKKDVELYEKAMKDIKDQAYGQYINQTLPVIKKHYQRAQEINQTLEPKASLK